MAGWFGTMSTYRNTPKNKRTVRALRLNSCALLHDCSENNPLLGNEVGRKKDDARAAIIKWKVRLFCTC